MDVEVHVDRTAYRRYRRGTLLSLLAFALYLPAMILILTLMAVVLGREAVGHYGGTVFFTGFVALMATMFYGTRSSFFYRCPRCGRRLSRVVPRGQSEPNIHYHCGIAVSYGISVGLGVARAESADSRARSRRERPPPGAMAATESASAELQKILRPLSIRRRVDRLQGVATQSKLRSRGRHEIPLPGPPPGRKARRLVSNRVEFAGWGVH